MAALMPSSILNAGLDVHMPLELSKETPGTVDSSQELFDLLDLQAPIHCVDIGAYEIGNKADPWVELARKGLAKVIGFEPIEKECHRLNTSQPGNQDGINYLPYAIGDGEKHRLHITNTGMTSSLYPPAMQTLNLFHNLGELVQVEYEKEIVTKRLDDIPDALSADFIKLDIQGAELMALQHAENTLKGVSVVQCEVEFVELYENQPLFADIDTYLRSQGFNFFRFTHLAGPPFKPILRADNPHRSFGQILWGDAVYVKDFRKRSTHTDRVLKSAAYILHEFYKAYDVSHLFLEELDLRTSRKLAGVYRSRLLGIPRKSQRSKKYFLSDGTIIAAPDSLNLLTPYVLLEQKDWFEDEIQFARKLLQQGDTTLDIGANYGLYTVSLAKAVGPKGKVIAFEPASATASFLKETVHANGFNHVKVEVLAVSNRNGTAQLALHRQPELNSLKQNGESGGLGEEVHVTSLDHYFEANHLERVDFIKLDAEGEEANILEGGRQFFRAYSPIIQYEIKAGSEYHPELITSFTELGYQSYRLIPGLHLLAPFDAEIQPDPYLLNLFACKPEQANRLRNRGLLAASTKSQLPHGGKAQWSSSPFLSGHGSLPFAKSVRSAWDTLISDDTQPLLMEALNLYAVSMDSDLTPDERASCLRFSMECLKKLCEQDPSCTRLACLARAASDFGARALAVAALRNLIDTLMILGEVTLQEPFLPPCKRFEHIEPGSNFVEWLMAATLEELEKLTSFSSFFTGNESRERLETIAQLGYGSDDMKRRLALIEQRYPHTPAAGG